LCVGDNSYGRLGANVEETVFSEPQQVPGQHWSDVTVGTYTVCATKEDGTLWCWGNRIVLGLGRVPNAFVPQRLCLPSEVWW
jgi:alpha-tubulin suppressor-like RCC1 family protein